MRKETMNVRLALSTTMDGKSDTEHEYIRIPRRARLYFNSDGERFVITVGNKRKVLKIKPAFKGDIRALKGELDDDNITAEQANITGFVTTQTLNYLVGRKRKDLEKHCYITDGVDDLMLGADPEFVLVDPNSGRYKYAQHVEGFSGLGQLGHDGPLAEVRPAPSTSVDKVVENMRDILSKDKKRARIDSFNWLAGATFKSSRSPDDRIVHIGGHIHIGNPALLEEPNKNAVYRRIIQVLDETVGLPFVKIDTPSPHLRRNTAHNGYGRYGRWGDQRPQEGRFEWRVLSGLWLAHPEISRAVLGTTKAVSEACYQLMAENNFDPNWINAEQGAKGFLKKWGCINPDKAAKMLNDSDPSKVPPAIVNRAAKKLKNMSTYRRYKTEIDEFIKLVKLSQRDRNNLNLDIKDTWLGSGKIIK